ncbi:hypothetical protein R3W88_021872 [Solanum pinnatisectum]|uniref:DUF7890 domain-containing protein n=1 Tax=Solanum pinnatisectum TaxID=50273 RepID=A0AAV9LWG1_9SOLN|nr:hypothetical protein R3W88_021872 [Solanum pinnatisectum]
MVITMGFASSLLKEMFFGRKINSKKYNKVDSTTNFTYVCRDELDKKKPKIKKQVKFDLEPKSQQEEETSTLLELNKSSGTSLEKYKVSGGDGDNDRANSNGVKVKILMRKEDAARLLLKCREGGVLEFKDVAQELVQIPSSYVRVISSPSRNIHESHDCSLKTIPEER